MACNGKSPTRRLRQAGANWVAGLLAVALSCGGCSSGFLSTSGGGSGGGGDGGGGGGGPGPGADDPPVPAGAHYVATDGDDAAAGTRAAPWRTVARGLRGIGAGDTLVLRGGTYFEHDVRVALAGTAAAPIVVRSEPGEQPVLDAGFAQFRAAGNQDWQVVDAQRSIYRSSATFPGAGQVYGYLDAQDGGYRLVPYESLGPLSADLEDYSETAPFYCGPGVFWNSSDQRIYVRLAHGRYQARLGHDAPADIDPRHTPLRLFPSRSVLSFAGSNAHVEFRGLRLRHGESPVDLPSGCHDLSFVRCEFLGGRYEILLRDGVHDVLFDGISVPARFPPWVARSDVKRPDATRPAHLLQGAAVAQEGAVARIEIRNSTFTGLFDAIDTTDVPTDWNVHHCEFTTIRDDVFEVATAGHGIDFHHNVVTESAAAVSWNGSVAPTSGCRGKKYVHHNVLDTSRGQLYGRDDPQHLLPTRWRGPRGDGIATGLAFSTHDTSSLNGPDPWKIYHNTIVGGEDVDTEGLGVCYRFPPFDANDPHEVFNNVFVQTGDQWIARHGRVADGSQVFDGNLYFRTVAAPTTSLLEDFSGSGGNVRFGSLVAFLTSSLWLQSRGHYAPGWEAAGVEGDPALDAQYRPAPGGPAASGAVDLRGKNWPDHDRLSYRGALPPR